MNKTKSLSVISEKTLIKLLYFSLFLGIVFLAPLLKNQAITGPIVNAILFLSVMFLGIKGAIFIAVVSSIVALFVGFLPMFFLPIIPFIIISNIILIVSFDFLKKRNYWLRVFFSSLAKFAFLSIVVGSISSRVLLLSWPQFLTALTGGIIAYVFSKQKTYL